MQLRLKIMSVCLQRVSGNCCMFRRGVTPEHTENVSHSASSLCTRQQRLTSLLTDMNLSLSLKRNLSHLFFLLLLLPPISWSGAFTPFAKIFISCKTLWTVLRSKIITTTCVWIRHWHEAQSGTKWYVIHYLYINPSRFDFWPNCYFFTTDQTINK